MADTYTKNLNLKKPGYDSPADIEDINANMDKIDEAFENVDATSLNGKDAKYYSQPRNLLDNSGFEVAQAGYGGYHGSEIYAADRWISEAADTTFSYNKETGLTITAGEATAVVCQKISQEDAELMVGKTYTLAVYGEDGVFDCASGVVVNDEQCMRFKIGNATCMLHFFTSAPSYQACRIVASAGKTAVIKAVVLYEGTYTADNLPPYIPKGYAAELAECSRWYTRGTYQTARPYALSSNTTAYLCDVKYPVPMEVEHLPVKQPTVNISNIKVWVSQSDAGISATKNIGDNTGFNSVNLSGGLGDAIIQFDYEASADL